METTATITARIRRSPLDAFLGASAFITEMAEQIANFDPTDIVAGGPDAVTWTNVATLAHIADLLERAVNAMAEAA